MYKLLIEKSYEFTIKAPKLKDFDVEFSIVTEKINFNIKLNKKGNDIFELVIPKELRSIVEKSNYNIFLYSENNRFSVDSGQLEILESVENKIDSVEIKLESFKPKIDLKDMIKKDYMNKKVKNILKDIKK
jgi:hypothetical protein